MWGSLLALAVMTTVSPLRLGVILLLISRPRPMQNLFAYWIACAIAGLYGLITPLVLLHVIPTFNFLTDVSNPAANPTIRHIFIAIGVLCLLVAMVMGVLLAANQQARQPPAPATSDDTSAPALESHAPRAISRLLSPSQNAATEDGSAIRRLLRRIREAWENGSVWVAFVIGMVMGPTLDGIVFVLALIVASGASLGVQITAAIVFVFTMLAVEEIILVSNLVTPARTQASLRRLHHWALANRRKLVVALFALVGASLVAHGMLSA
ncbi:GAP family protein [Mycolicibacterium sp. ND9-15]|uniref:GAP family protein n=1 Tax=Mycolicibacterium sp. ND9-15 TaxID=3042320 RepID=UPI002DD7EECC|nr:GAP family protein [Mycolicibacterium sp. ND9-15]WSE54918.1 GAP family protein [Mycolicibacterium sp. ND9-15]